MNIDINQMPCGFLSLSKDGVIQSINDKLLDWISAERSNTEGRQVNAILTESSKLFYQLYIYPMMKMQGKVEEMYFSLKSCDGSEVPVLLNGICYERDGEIVFNCIIIRTVNRNKLEHELLLAKKAAQQAKQSIVDTAIDAIILANQDMKIIGWNKAAEELFGYYEQETIGQDMEIIVPEHHIERYRQVVEPLYATGLTTAIGRMVELSGLRKDGTKFPAEITLNCWQTNGEYYWSAIIRDISERKKAQELLLNSEKLSLAGQLAASIAHEIRNPLTAIKGFHQLMKSENNGKPFYFEVLTDEMNRIELILSELLLLAKPQAKQLSQVDLRALLERVCILMESQMHLHNIEVELKCEEDVVTLINCNENQIKQIFINFLKNAIEAMPNGGQVIIMADNIDEDSVLFRIIDQGIGIPEDKLERIGEPFYTTKERGTGLGLMVCRKIIEDHQGSLNITSRLNKGTTVEVLLPLGENTQKYVSSGH
ncbi:PAS domain-containing sensor histidine kinase [Bacillus mesophilum]|uniref:histidine kinase n=1 Tax=Bacillus mesophilum TaxID=1071718 RepID=A0A7V7UWP5_9BACI|nr:PAS domain-containing sensor histidine kinase [Bacillus mesophilum]KAB2331375.1 PAS domain S-box protein [Bacillus mesophilum]